MADAHSRPHPRGKPGEEEARRFLEKRGYRILATNFRAAGGEVDIVAEKGGILCFTEVKTRRSEDFGLPEEFVSPGKQKRLIRVAKIYSSRKPHREKAVRFDIVSVIMDGRVCRTTILENAFEE